MFAPAEAFTRRPIVFMDDYAGAGQVFMPDTTMPALAILIADYCGSGGNGGQPKCAGAYNAPMASLLIFIPKLRLDPGVRTMDCVLGSYPAPRPAQSRPRGANWVIGCRGERTRLPKLIREAS